MQIIRTVAELREALAPLRERGVGFVPTMGALHEGHLSLVHQARKDHETVVMSIFVNPTQFDNADDLAKYTRDEQRDVDLAGAAGVDVVFAPSIEEMYPAGFGTTVRVTGTISESFEGAARGPVHFEGMATIVTKLLLAVLPTTVYFGAKDAQQVVIARRLIADLLLPVELSVVPTSRDADGLARSSRNVRLSPEERATALAIPAALNAAEALFRSGETRAQALHDAALRELTAAGLAPDYLAFVDPDTLEDVTTASAPTLVLVAVKVGETRLLDNVLLQP